MNVKTKTTFIIIFTLLLGVALGSMLNRALLQRRIARTLSWRNPTALASNLEDLLSPQGKNAGEIRKILGEYAEALVGLRESSQQDMQELMQSLESSLDPYLTPEQKQSLRRKPLSPSGWGKRRQGFPPGMKPQRPGTDELDVLTQRLGLTPEQVSKVGELLQPSRSLPPFGANDADRNADRALNPFSNRNIPALGQRGMGDIANSLARWLERQKELDQAISGILSEAQNQEYETIKQERRQKLLELLN